MAVDEIEKLLEHEASDVRDFREKRFGWLFQDKRVLSNPRLFGIFRGICEGAYHVRFIEDYWPSPDGLGLSELDTVDMDPDLKERFLHELGSLPYHEDPSFYISQYLREYNNAHPERAPAHLVLAT